MCSACYDFSMETFRRFIRRGDVLLGLGIWIVAGLVALGDHFDLNKSEWASWVQAVGSVAALAVAVFIMAKQARSAAALVADSDRISLVRRGSAVEALIANAHATIFVALGRIEEGLNDSIRADWMLTRTVAGSLSLTEARATLSTVPLHELGSEKLVSATLEYLEAMMFLINTFEEWRSSGSHQFSPVLARQVVNRYKSNADNALNKFREGLATLGTPGVHTNP